MFDLGSIIAHIKADISDFQSGMKRAESDANGFGSTLKKIGSDIADFGKQAAVFTGVIGAGLTLATKTGLESAAQFEQYQVAFTTLLKDQKAAATAIKNIQKDAAATPFELAPLVAANQRLISAGISADQARKNVISLGNAISATGGSGVELERLSTNLQQIKAVGKATALDIKQFAFAGINVYQLLADATGKNVKEVQDMEVSYELLMKAFDKASQKGGMFEGAMEKQSKTLNGLISTLKDTVSLGLKDILVNSGIFDAIRNGVASMIPALESGVASTTRFFTVLSNGISLLQSIMSGENVLSEVREFISYFTGGQMPEENHPAVQFMYFLANALKTLGDWVVANHELVMTFLQGLAVAVGALLIIGTVTALLTALLNPLTLVALGIAALYTAWQTNFLGIQTITQAVVDFIVNIFNTFLLPTFLAFSDWLTTYFFPAVNNVFNGLLVPMFNSFVAWFKERWDFIMMMISGTWQIIRGIITIAWNYIYGFLTAGLQILTGDWKGAHETLQNIGKKNWEAIKGILNGVVDFIKGWAGIVFNALVEPFERAWQKVKELAEKIKGAMDPNQRHSPSLVDRVEKGVRDLNSAWEGVKFGTQTIAASMTSTSAVGIAPAGGGMGNTTVVVDMNGAYIGNESVAQQMGEKIGDQIIKKLQVNLKI